METGNPVGAVHIVEVKWCDSNVGGKKFLDSVRILKIKCTEILGVDSVHTCVHVCVCETETERPAGTERVEETM